MVASMCDNKLLELTTEIVYTETGRETGKPLAKWMAMSSPGNASYNARR